MHYYLMDKRSGTENLIMSIITRALPVLMAASLAGCGSSKPSSSANDMPSMFEKLPAGSTAEAGDSASYGGTETAVPTEEEVQQAIYDQMPGMDCWGDSITEGFLGDGVTWPDTFSELFDLRIMDPIRQKTGYAGLEAPTVRNMGVSTETVPEITGRRGAVPFVTDGDLVIPADRTPVEIGFVSSYRGSSVKPLRYGNGMYGGNGINPVLLAGVPGTLTRYFDEEKDSSVYRFERTDEGSEVAVPSGELLLTDASGRYSEDFCVIMMGANGGYEDAGDLAALFGKMTAMQDNDRYLVVGMGCTPEDSGLLTAEEEELLSERFGDRFISLQAWMSKNGIDCANSFFDAGITPSEEDEARIAAGQTPCCLLNPDRLHFTPTGYRVIGCMIFDEMERLGYFDGLKALAESGDS